MRVKATIAYDGSVFNGFQIQKHELKYKKSIAGFITKELKELNIMTTIIGSGRTDVNVHATHQVIHFDIPSFWSDVEKLRLSLNERIKPHVFIHKTELVDDTFHARFDAKKRLYRYILYHGAYQPIFANYALHVEHLDVCLINECAKVFLGKHNFAFFKKSDGGKTKEEREIFKAGAYSYNNFTIIYFLGDAFLRSQIRLMCGFLLKISNKELTIDDLKKQLTRQDRVSTATIPACGLYLSRVYY